MECCFKVVSKDGPKTFQDHFKRPIVFGRQLNDIGTKGKGTQYLEQGIAYIGTKETDTAYPGFIFTLKPLKINCV